MMAPLKQAVLVVCLMMYRSAFCSNIAIQNFTLAMPGMVVGSERIRDDCHNGILSNISFHVDFTFATDTFCYLSVNPFFPVEWTSTVEALIRYNEKAQESYASCIIDQSCDNINMSDWKQIAREQYKACRYCEESAGPACTRYQTELDKQRVKAIIDSMFLYARYKCTRDMDKNGLLIAPVTWSEVLKSAVVKLRQTSFTCRRNEWIDIVHVTEQADQVRMRVRADNSRLRAKIEQSLWFRKTDAVISIPADHWSVQGSFYWGTNKTRQTDPYCLIIHYECTLGASATARTLATRNSNRWR